MALTLVATFHVGAAAPAPDGGGGEQPPPLELVGGLTARGADGQELPNLSLKALDPGLGRVVAASSRITVNVPDSTVVRNDLVMFDTETLEQVAALDLRDVTAMDLGLAASALDQDGHRLFLADNGSIPDPAAPTEVLIVDLTGADPVAVRELDLSDPLSEANGGAVVAWTYEPATGLLYALTGPRNLGTKSTLTLASLQAIDADALAAGDPDPVVWTMPVQSTCPAIPFTRGSFIGSGGGYVYFPCAGDGAVGFKFAFMAPPTMHGIMRVRPEQGVDASQFETEFFPFGGNLAEGFATGDAGNDLLFVATASAGNQKLFVFDAVRGAWTGAVKLGNANTVGTAADPSTGRIYQMDSGTGQIKVTEGNRVAVPQGSMYQTDVTRFPTLAPPLIDPITNRLFFHGAFVRCETRVRPCPQGETINDDSPLGVFQDNLPPAPPPKTFDPDGRTEDVPEQPGETIASLSGNAQAFGARYTFVGGSGRSRTAKPHAFAEQFTEPRVRDLPVGPNTRDVLFGQAIGASLAASSFGSTQVGASAAGLVSGDQTVNDIRANSNVQCAASNFATSANDPTVSEQTGFEVPDPGCFEESDDEQAARRTDGLSWPDEFPEELRGHVSLCRVFGGEQEQQAKPGSAVNCDPSMPMVEAASVFDANEPSPFSVGHAEAVASVVRDGERGTIATAEAVARGVNILGVIRIGEIRTVAEARAHGRPGTAATTLNREAYQVAIGPPGSEPAFTCGFGEEPCDLHQVAEAINRYLQPRIRAFVPPPATAFDEGSDFRSPDEDISNGTDGGAKATVEMDPYEFQSNKIINTIRQFEVPALTITAYDDHKEPSRHILQFGAVALDANYTVSELPSFDFAPPGGGFGGPVPGSGSGDGGLDVDLPGQQAQRAIQVPPFEPLTGTASQTDLDLPVQDLLAGGGHTGGDGGAGQPAVPSGPAGPVSSGEAPSLSTASGPGVDGGDGPAPEVAAPAGEGDGELPPQAAASDQQQLPGGLTLTQQQIGETVPMAALWLLIALPIYLAVRRRGLINSTRR